MAQITLNSSGVASSGSLLLQTNGTTTQATVDTSGNLGLGVTPSAWGTYNGVLDLKGNGSLAAYNQAIALAANAYYNGSNWIYKSTTTAGFFQVAGNAFQWYQAPSGTAGNVATFNQAMTLDASSNLQLGTTTSNGRLTLKNPSAGSEQVMLAIQAASSTSAIGRITYDQTVDTLRFTNMSSFSGSSVRFGNNGLDQVTIDLSGNLLVGTTALNGSWGTRLTLSSNSGSTTWAVGPYSTATNFVISAGSGVGVYLGGTSATSWSSASDERVKTDLQPIENAAQKVSTLRAVTGRYIADETQTRKAFLIAQDVQAVLPEAVNVQDDEQGTLGLAYTDVIPLLVAAIKELKAEIDVLKGQA